MNPFEYTRASAAAGAIQSLVKQPQAHLLAGGTNLIDLIKMGVLLPERLVDINPFPLGSVTRRPRRPGSATASSSTWRAAGPSST